MQFPFRRFEEACRLLDERAVEWFLKGLSPSVKRALLEQWKWQAHGGQEEPVGDWRTWLLMAGRGFGKTWTGANWIWERAREVPGARIALVAGTADEAVKVMIEGESGLLAMARSDERPRWRPTQGIFCFPSGAEAFLYSGANPEGLRGPEHHFAWCDELAKWRRGERAFDNLQMGLRLGEAPRLIVTTTPKATRLLRRVRAMAGTAETNGRTEENVHSADAFRRWAEETYGGTRLGRQELGGELLDEAEGALWTREIIERSRQKGTLPRVKRVVVGVDPPASAEGNACGIVVCGLGEDGRLYVLADCSVAGLRPEGWARAVVTAAEVWEAGQVVAEKNQGGDMVESVLRAAAAHLPVRLAGATRGKAARAEPVALLFEAGKALLAGHFPKLEDEMVMISHAGGFAGGGSPDRLDAMVWAMGELAGPARAEPRVTLL